MTLGGVNGTTAETSPGELTGVNAGNGGTLIVPLAGTMTTTADTGGGAERKAKPREDPWANGQDP